MDQSTPKAPPACMGAMVLEEGRKRLGLFRPRPWAWVIVIKNQGRKRPSDISQDAVLKVALKETGYTSATSLSSRHPATATITDDAKGVLPAVCLRQEAAVPFASILGRNALIATGAASLAVCSSRAYTSIATAARGPEVTTHPCNALLRPDPPPVDTPPRVVISDDGTGNANAYGSLPRRTVAITRVVPDALAP